MLGVVGFREIISGFSFLVPVFHPEEYLTNPLHIIKIMKEKEENLEKNLERNKKKNRKKSLDDSFTDFLDLMNLIFVKKKRIMIILIACLD